MMTDELKPCPFCGGEATYVMGLPGCEPCALVRRDEQSWNRRSDVAGFRAGIEAAAKWHAERADSYFRRMDQTPPSSKRSFLAGRHSFHTWACEEIRTLSPAAPEPTDDMMERLSAWWRSWDTGLSSEAIALFLGMGVKSEHTPSDAADLGRCLRLLDKIPEWRPRLPKMRDAGGAWPFIVDRWPELEAHYKLENWDVVYATLNAAHREHRARFEPVEQPQP